MALTDEQLAFVSYIDQVYWSETPHRIPTDEKIAETLKFTSQKVKACWKVEAVRQSLGVRGVNFNQEADEAILTPQQILTANVLLNTLDKSSIRQKLEGIGVTTTQYQGWLNDKTFKAYLKNRAEVIFAGAEPNALLGIVKAVEGGDLKAIQFFMEVTGRYNPRLQIEVNVDTIINRVVDVVSRYVSAEVMERIAMDLEGVTESGFRPNNLPSSREEVMQAVASGAIEVSYSEKKPEIGLSI
jgi:Ni,Fe-hydrogenase III component G